MNMYSDDLIKEKVLIKDGYAKVPENPGLGIEIDEEALAQLRKPNYDKPGPDDVFCVVWASGKRTYYNEAQSYYKDFWAGNEPVFERKVRLEVIKNDGSVEFKKMKEKVNIGFGSLKIGGLNILKKT